MDKDYCNTRFAIGGALGQQKYIVGFDYITDLIRSKYYTPKKKLPSDCNRNKRVQNRLKRKGKKK